MNYVYMRVMQRAAEVVGGIEPLAKRLGVGSQSISSWADGTATPPKEMFLRAVDIVMEHDSPNDSGHTTANFQRPA